MECIKIGEEGIRAVCDGVAYVQDSYSSSHGELGALLSIAIVGVLATAIVAWRATNRDWRRALIETGNEKAYLDVVKAKRVYRVQGKGSQVE